jgi:hypothetical protein
MNKLPDLKLAHMTLEDTDNHINFKVTNPVVNNGEEIILTRWIRERHKKHISTMMFKRVDNQLFIKTPELQ